MTLTVAGGIRAVPVVGEQEVALIALHLDEGMDFKAEYGGKKLGRFLPFPNIKWKMGPWGTWWAEGVFDGLRVLVEASCD